MHGIADEFLLDKPTFADVADGMDLVFAARAGESMTPSFDIGFMDYEFGKLNRGIGKTETFCGNHRRSGWRGKCSRQTQRFGCVMFPRYEIDNSKRTLHGHYSMPRSLPMSC